MYEYQKIRPILFTDEGSRKFLKAFQFIKVCLQKYGCFRMEAVLMHVSGDAWEAMACVDRLVEIGEIREVMQKDVAGQHRIFVEAR